MMEYCQVSGDNVIVQDSAGKSVESQFLPVSAATLRLRSFYTKAYLGISASESIKYWLAFSASVPPLGYSTYTVSAATQTG